MTTEYEQSVFTRATHAPWREILRQRWSGRADRVLVLRDHGGVHYVVGLRRGQGPRAGLASTGVGEPGPSSTVAGTGPRARTLAPYESAYHVYLGERNATRSVGLPTSYGTEPVDVRVQWWVHDPVQAVRAQVTHGWDAVRDDLAYRLREVDKRYAAEGSTSAPSR
ncbi:hypothetical protein NKH77_25615 [Streptomyces sp. M19]